MKLITILSALLFSLTTFSQGTWSLQTEFPDSARVFAVAFSIGDKGYFGTGQTATGIEQKDFWEYDPATNAWTQLTDFPGTARHAAVGFSANGKGYIGTGNDGALLHKDFWEYDPVTDAWTQIDSLPGPQRNNAVAFSIDDVGYVVTGWYRTWYQDFWAYDAVAGSWSQKTDFPGSGRIRAVGFAAGGKGYVTTGHTSGSHAGFNDLWEYDPVTDTSTQGPDIPVVRHGAAAFGLDGRGYVTTGYENSAYVNTTFEYDTYTGTWSEVDSAVEGHIIRASAFGIGEVGYVVSGQTDVTTFTQHLLRYEPVWMGLDETKEPNTLLYPNPATDIVWLKTSNLTETTVRLIDLNGRSIREWTPTSTLERVPIDELPAGCYFLQIRDRAGKVWSTHLLVQ